MSDARWMQSALTLARRGLGQTWPNPTVGCLIVRDGRVLGRGVTAPGGRPHAETIALDQTTDATGATAYVTLEPCAHHGKTPPCVEALISKGIKRVVCPIEDADPRVSGRGIAALKAAGVEVEVGCLADEARAINAGFLSRIELGRPFVTLKLATSLDGRIATRTGKSRWITGPAARRRVHLMRAQHDAVLVGAGTARTDDPSLNVRDIGLDHVKPVRIVTDSGLSLPLTSKLARTARDQALWVLHRPQVDAVRAGALSDLGATPISCKTHEGSLDMEAALRELAARGITWLMVEGGGRIAASLLSAGLVDRIALFTAGNAIGNDGVPAVQGFGLEALVDAPRLTLERAKAIGPDTLSWWRRD